MIITKKIKVKTTNKNISHFKKIDSTIKSGDYIEVDINQLSKGSRQKIKVNCFKCNKEKEISFKVYNRLTNDLTKHYYCNDCKYERIKESNNLKYNIDNVFQLDETKEKIKQTNLTNFGCEHNSQNIIVKQKMVLSSKNTKFKNNIKYYKNKNIKLKDMINDDYIIECNKCCQDFKIERTLLNNRISKKIDICTLCNPIHSYTTSQAQKDIQQYIQQNYNGEMIVCSKKIIYPYEIDIFLPDLKLAFEFNGLYWHNEINKPNNYHLIKTNMCKDKNINLIHIWEDDWIYKKDIIKSLILNKLNLYSYTINSSECEIKEIKDNKLIKYFLNVNHLKGYTKSNIKIGLFHKNELVSLMIFTKKSQHYILKRFCNKLNINITDSHIKIFKYFLNVYKPINTFVYCDVSNYETIYEDIGFKYEKNLQPDYSYVLGDIRKNKNEYFKHKPEKRCFKIYDCGQIKFKYVKT